MIGTARAALGGAAAGSVFVAGNVAAVDNVATFTATKPAAAAAGDLMIVVARAADFVTVNSGGTGFSLIDAHTNRAFVWGKVLTGAEGATIAGFGSTGALSDWVWVAAVFRGAALPSVTAKSTDTNAGVAPSVTMPAAGNVFRFWSTLSATVMTVPAGVTSIGATTGPRGLSVLGGYQVVPAGATGTAAAVAGSFPEAYHFSIAIT